MKKKKIMKTSKNLASTLLVVCGFVVGGVRYAQSDKNQVHIIHPLALTDVTIQGSFWSPKLKVWDKKTVYDVFNKFEGQYTPDRKYLIDEKAKTGRTRDAFLNFDMVAQGKKDIHEHEGPEWYDGLIYESIRGTVAQQNKIIVNAGQVLNSIPSTLYGSCIEDVNHEIYGGLYDQKIMGESFEEPSSGVNYNEWRKYNGYWAADKEYSDESVSIIPGRHSRRMVAKNELGTEPDQSSKLIYGVTDINEGVVEADMRFLQSKGDGGSILIRVTDPGIGENAYTGYEVRLSRVDNKIKLIKHQNNFVSLSETPVAFNSDQWNHVKIDARNSHIYVYLNHAVNPVIDYNDTNKPLLHGKIGLATAGSPVSFRNVTATISNIIRKLPLIRPENQQISDRWDAVQTNVVNAKFFLPQRHAFNGITAQVIEIMDGGGRAGVANRSLNRWGIAVEKGQVFTGSCYLHTEGNSLPVTVALESADGTKSYAKQNLLVANTGWKQYPFTLTSNVSDTNARFVIYFEQKGKLYIDQVTLMSTGNKQYKGLPMRADIGDALVSEGLTFMRYGGTMVNASGYRFKKMISNRSSRPPYTGHWNEYSTNGFGIEDFLQFCEASRITPAFAINIEETAQDAADMVEYLNGDTTTEWGKKRAVNGHPNPYGIKYLEIGNEEVLFEGDDSTIYNHYIERFLDLYNAIHKKDTAIALVCSVWWRPESPNTERLFKAIDGKAAYWDYHVGGDDPNSGFSVDKELTRMQNLFHQWNPATKMKCAIFEENGGMHNMQRALGHATNLNAVRRHGDFILTSCPANALQPYLQNDNGWDQGQIFFTPTQVWGMPPFYAQQMAANNHLPLRVQDSVNCNLDVTATRSKDGKSLVLHVVNTDSLSQTASILLNDFVKPNKRVQVWTLAGNLQSQNIPGNSENVATKKTTTNLLSGTETRYTFPAFSYTILKFEK